MEIPEQVTVKCFSGHEYPERPESFTWHGREYGVEEVERAWQEPGERRFRVKTDSGQRFELRYDEKEDRWELTSLFSHLAPRTRESVHRRDTECAEMEINRLTDIREYQYTIMLQPEPEKGGYSVTVPALPGCFAQGETVEEAIALAKEAIAAHIQGMIEDGEPVPEEDGTLTAVVKVAS